jgi:hypothetical protein
MPTKIYCLAYLTPTFPLSLCQVMSNHFFIFRVLLTWNNLAPSSGLSFMNAVITHLEQDDCVIIHVHPSDFTNVTNAMKTIISGFVQQESDIGTPPHQASSSMRSS